jgi:hypothetical protein
MSSSQQRLAILASHLNGNETQPQTPMNSMQHCAATVDKVCLCYHFSIVPPLASILRVELSFDNFETMRQRRPLVCRFTLWFPQLHLRLPLQDKLSPLLLSDEPIRVCVAGAAGNIAYSLLFMIANGDMFGNKKRISLRLLVSLSLKFVPFERTTAINNMFPT